MSSDPNKKVKLLFACLDWRLHSAIENYFLGSADGCDLCVTAGSVKGLIDPFTQKYFLEQIDISKKLHNCQAVILTMHMDCGAYGGSRAFPGEAAETANCQDQLNQAKTIVERNFPDLLVETYIIGLRRNEDGWDIQPQEVSL
jgi:hypothetical protein